MADLANIFAVLKDQYENDRSCFVSQEEYDRAYAAYLERRLEIIGHELRGG